jgi:hypothetical protein
MWGTWLPQSPPQISSETLLSIAKQEQPFILIDPLRFGHSAEENDSGEMSTVMLFSRACAAAGGAVCFLHHPSKAEGSTGRGSTAIRGAVDLSYLQEMSEETGLITLRCVKNRFGEKLVATIKPNYETGEFIITDSPEFSRRAGEMTALRRIIEQQPGVTTNAIYKQAGMHKGRLVQLLETGTNQFWEMRKDGIAKTAARRYFPLVLNSQNKPEQADQARAGGELVPCSLPYREQGNKSPTMLQPDLRNKPEQASLDVVVESPTPATAKPTAEGTKPEAHPSEWATWVSEEI